MAHPPAFIDTHIHLWDLDRLPYPWLDCEEAAPLRSNYLPAHLLAGAQGLDLLATVHVQAEVDHAVDPAAETRWLEELRIETGVPAVSIGYADLRAPDLEAVLDRHCAVPSFRGIRQEAWYDPDSERADMPRENFLDDPRWAEGLAVLARRKLSFDLFVWHYQLDQARRIFREVPDLTVVLEHCGLPLRDPSPDKIEWRRSLRRFAADVPHALLKISAMRFLGNGWASEEVRAHILNCIDCFGPDRCLFGSDFPVERTNGAYGDLWKRYAEIIAPFPDADRHAMFVGNAARVYRIPV